MPELNFITLIAIEISLVSIIVCIAMALKIRSIKRFADKLKEKTKALNNKHNSTPLFASELLSEMKLTEAAFITENADNEISGSLTAESVIAQALSLRFYALKTEYSAISKPKIPPHQKALSIAQDYKKAIEIMLSRVTNDTITQLEQENTALQDTVLTHTTAISTLELANEHYKELEARLHAYQNEAKDNIASMASLNESESNKNMTKLLESYTKNHNNLSSLLEQSTHLPKHLKQNNKVNHEIENLRRFAATQHRMITQLQKKLSTQSRPSYDEKTLNKLCIELKKQKQFVKESEVCMMLMEDELTCANQQIYTLQQKIKKNLSEQPLSEEKDLELSLLTEENTKLKDQLTMLTPQA